MESGTWPPKKFSMVCVGEGEGWRENVRETVE